MHWATLAAMKEGTSPRTFGRALFEEVRPATAATALLLAQEAMRLGQADAALELSAAAREAWGDDPGLLLFESMVLARTLRTESAKRQLELAAGANADGLVPTMVRATLAIEARRPDEARRALREVIRRCPDYPGVAGSLASLLMPGPNYREVLASLHRMTKPRGYLEVGVETGATLALAAAERIVGVDPDLSPLRRDRISPEARLYEMTSAAFFAQHDRVAVFDRIPVDLVFIDGLHRYEAALADFAEVERWAHPKTVVVMHDALPVAPVYADPERRTRFWVGDVWKAVYVLLTQRSDLRIRIIPTVPSGLVVIRWQGRSPWMSSEQEIWRAAPTELPALSEVEPVWPAGFPLVPNDAQGHADALLG